MQQKNKNVPRGIRNNNPLNIRIGNVWLGERSNSDDPIFEQFVSMEYGIRAGFVLLRRYINHYKRKSIFGIISAWAPPHENSTDDYIQRVTSLVGIDKDDCIAYEDMQTMVKLVDAMILIECGQHVPIEKIEKAYKMA